MHVEGQDLLDVVLHLVERPPGVQPLITTEHLRAGRLADVQVRLPGLGLQRDDLRPESPQRDGVQVAAFKLPVPCHAAIAHPAVECRDHLDPSRPVLRNERPLDPGVVRVGHADEPAAAQRCLPAAAITKAEMADEGRVPDVKLVTVAQQLHIGEPDRVLALDPQAKDQPVRQVDEVLVEHGQATQDRRLAVIASVHVGTGIVHTIGVLPFGRATRTQVAVARRGERFAKPLSLGVEAVIGEQEIVHGASSSARDGHTVVLTTRAAETPACRAAARDRSTFGPCLPASARLADGRHRTRRRSLRIHGREPPASKMYPLRSVRTAAAGG